MTELLNFELLLGSEIVVEVVLLIYVLMGGSEI